MTYFITANEGDARTSAAEAAGGSVTYGPKSSAERRDARSCGVSECRGLAGFRRIGRLNVINHAGNTDGDARSTRSSPTAAAASRSSSRTRTAPSSRCARPAASSKIIASPPNATRSTTREPGGVLDSRSDNKGPEPEGVEIARSRQAPTPSSRSSASAASWLRRHRPGERQLRQLSCLQTATDLRAGGGQDHLARPTARPATRWC